MTPRPLRTFSRRRASLPRTAFEKAYLPDFLAFSPEESPRSKKSFCASVRAPETDNPVGLDELLPVQFAALGPGPPVYNLPFWKPALMEAERINILANRLSDLTGRCTELRRYL